MLSADILSAGLRCGKCLLQRPQIGLLSVAIEEPAALCASAFGNALEVEGTKNDRKGVADTDLRKRAPRAEPRPSPSYRFYLPPQR